MAQRFLSGGVDQPLLGRFKSGDGMGGRNVAFVVDRQGTTLAAVQPNGEQDGTVAYFGRNAFGKLEGATTGGATNTETGFTGASTPNQIGGFTYLRNRWYDPATGRFLTQDPIGLAGGVNLYAYAGNNPVTFTDPFGLKECEQRGNCTQADGGEMEARGVAMRRSDVIEPTDASPLFLIGGIQRKGAAAAGKVVSVSEDFVSRAIERGVKPATIMDALRNPLKIGEIVKDALGRPSQQFVGRGATVVRNPETGNLITLWPTSTKRVQKLLKELG